jgi:hypothetical protein
MVALTARLVVDAGSFSVREERAISGHIKKLSRSAEHKRTSV